MSSGLVSAVRTLGIPSRKYEFKCLDFWILMEACCQVGASAHCSRALGLSISV
jgi:hypothetical protein